MDFEEMEMNSLLNNEAMDFEEYEMNALLENGQEEDDLEPNAHRHSHANKKTHKKHRKHVSEPETTSDKGDVVIVEFLDTAGFLN